MRGSARARRPPVALFALLVSVIVFGRAQNATAQDPDTAWIDDYMETVAMPELVAQCRNCQASAIGS